MVSPTRMPRSDTSNSTRVGGVLASSASTPAPTSIKMAKRTLLKRILIAATQAAAMPSAKNQSRPRSMCSCSCACQRIDPKPEIIRNSIPHADTRSCFSCTFSADVVQQRWRSRIAVYSSGLENRQVERPRGFESHLLRMERYSGIVQEGTKRAATLGFPTINIPLGNSDVSGIYAARVMMGEKEYPAAAFADPKRKI